MSSIINKPTGLGYQGSPWRLCEECGHSEQLHYGGMCGGCWWKPGYPETSCRSFCARKLSKEEKRIIEEQRQVDRELEYVGEALYRELKREHPSDIQDR